MQINRNEKLIEIIVQGAKFSYIEQYLSLNPLQSS